MDTIVQMLLQFQTSIKILHWQTLSYAKHIATDTLHTTMAANIDKFVEVMQGKYGRVKFERHADILLLNSNKSDDLNLLKFMQHWLETDLPKLIENKDTDLLNIRDEMLGSIKQTIYLFTLK